MKTVITLTYLVAPKETNSLTDAICGPQVFTSVEAAKDVLFQHVSERIKPNVEDALHTFMEEHVATLQTLVDDLSNTNEVLTAIQIDPVLRDALIDGYFDDAGYIIKELPAETFLDQLHRSKTIEIDGYTFDYIDMLNPDITLSLDDVLLSFDTDEDNPGAGEELYFTLGEAQAATYDNANNVWLVGNHRIKLSATPCNQQENVEEYVEEYKVLALSTAHLTLEDNDNLAETVQTGKNQMILCRDAGFFVKLYDQLESNQYTNMSESYRSLVTWAHNHGYKMIEFDCDATTMGLFPTYDW